MRIYVQYLLTHNYKWENLSSYTKYVSAKRQKRIENFVFERDKISSLLAELLIRQNVMNVLGLDNNTIFFSENAFGKPHLKGFPDYHFSVSHTDGCVAFVNSQEPIGIDTEKIVPYPADIVQNFFAPREILFVEESHEPTFAFYELWTRKEAYLKKIGTGLSTPLQSFDVLDDNLRQKFVTKKLPHHIISLCTDDAVNGSYKFIFNEIKIEHLLSYF